MSLLPLNRTYKQCACCGADAALFCSRCRVTPACSKECQQKFWKRHRAVCVFNAATPPPCEVLSVLAPPPANFDVVFPCVLVRALAGQEARATSVEEAAGRLEGLPEVEFGATEEEMDECIVGFGCEDRFVYKYRFRTSGTPANPNNFATHLTMVPDCCGDLLVFKINQCAVQDGEDDRQDDGSRGKRVPLTCREVWELVEYRYLLSRRGLISDRLHRANMQRLEALSVLQQSTFHDLGDLSLDT
jgi:hypothetical protein